MKWTNSQEAIIKSRNSNLLVAAGAGSGKTTVLNAHIMSLIDSGTDIDRLLVVTYTKDAAREMKERLRKKLKERAQELFKEGLEDEAKRLLMQEALIPSTDISTIDSLCAKIVRQYFYRINIDPAIRVGDKTELSLMKNDVCASMLEELYEGSEASDLHERFLDFRSVFGKDFGDDAIISMIITLYDKSRSFPDPDTWLDSCRTKGSEYIDDVFEEIINTVKYVSGQVEELYNLCLKKHLPKRFCDAIFSDSDGLKTITKSTSMEDFNKRFSEFKFSTKNSYKKRKEDAAEFDAKEDEIKDIWDKRESYKKIVEKNIKRYAGLNQSVVDLENSEMKETADTVIDLVLLFADKYAKAKMAAGICDFPDLEHWALDIVTDKVVSDDGVSRKPNDVAFELSENYEEVLVDEYQDCNDVQETLLCALSRQWRGQYNYFCVGDVKQSIYGFRQANPGLFMDKYDTYENSGDKVKIELSDNFRSRKGVIAFINDLFHIIMKKDFGGVDYNDDAALKAGATYPDYDLTEDAEIDYIVMDSDSQYTKEEQEARYVASRIVELMNPDCIRMVRDGDTQNLRPLRLNDIVILHTSVSTTKDSFQRIFKEYGINFYCAKDKNFFTSVEILNLLDYLRIIDNPMQDISLAASLRNVFGGFSANELAGLRLEGEKQGYKNFYDCVLLQRDKYAKVNSFMEKLDRYRELSNILPLHEFIQLILDETGFIYYVSALPGGDKRMKNVNALIAKAKDYENTSLKGLYNFIRYIERLGKIDEDIAPDGGDASTIDAVRFMTIHASKGLEFPIVFLCGCNKQFNQEELKKTVMISPEYGIGCDYRNAKYHYTVSTYKKEVVRNSLNKALLAEKQRVLYVALTRAKESLIMVGSGRDELSKFDDAVFEDTKMDTYSISRANTFMDWIMRAMFIREKQAKDTISPYILHMDESVTEAEGYRLRMRKIYSSEICEPVDSIYSKPVNTVNAYEHLDEKIKDILNYSYPLEKLTKLSASMSVTDIKRAAMHDEYVKEVYESPADEENAKKYMDKSDDNPGAKRGTAVHRFMELLRFEDINTEDISACVSSQMQELLNSGIYLKEAADLFGLSIVNKFFESSLAVRMIEAAKTNKLFKEKQFLIGVSVKDSFPDIDADDQILVRGIIDGFFIENGNIILMDYKTDKVYTDDGSDLAKKYKEQLVQYKNFLERATDMTVTECYLYSFSLGRDIRIKV